MSQSLSPETLQSIKRLDLRARMVVRGFLQGLHTSPLQGFSVQFSEHRRYNRGDDPKLIDWLVYAKTDKHYIKRFEAETNLTGYLVMDLSKSMGFSERQSMTKFEYATCLAASLTYLMTMQKDPVGLLTFRDKLRAVLPARSRRGHLGDVMAALSGMTPDGTTDLSASLVQVAAMLRHHSLVMLFSDLLGDPAEVLAALGKLRHSGHDVIVFHVMDEAEVHFPYEGPVEFEDPETGEIVTVDATGFRAEYLRGVEAFRETYREGCSKMRIDYVALDTSMPFDKALTEYLQQRQARF
ncbi:DUF58 domain-containing protein [Allorhodopirellula heiligendammensis]|uniref:DUF58 domain-containing protein n=1 Tax=Allorhodopirellula heiligendammensis TaxID=2714739 RepID=A0A5C6BD51_9BACT|nr:DUF58 domain-containing protein [Allorhodopirellula heiligendammensis]TWU10033.1 hypothetical protein Poly21_53660 [Allorhodopirellula heiligendammensis]|tara:strand:+ start:2655 stop:3542 length:888 start_codon:yes stop_codon:yes gene_type:complete